MDHYNQFPHLQPVVDYCLHQEEVFLHQEEGLDPLVQVDILVQLDYLHNLLVFVLLQQKVVGLHINQGLNIEVKLNLMDHYNQFPHLQEEVPGLLVHRFEDNQEHKGYHHNLDLVLFHLEEVGGQLVNMQGHLDFHRNSFLQIR